MFLSFVGGFLLGGVFGAMLIIIISVCSSSEDDYDKYI